MGQKEISSQLGRNASLMGIATFLSRISGLLREQVFAYFFGAGLATDAFNVAFRIPNLLRDLFAEGALSSALVPTFTRVRDQEGERRSWRVAGLVFRVLFGIAALICVVGILFSSDLVRLYAASFQSNAEKFDLTVQLTQMMYPFFPLVALAAAFMAVLNALGVFFWPAFASALFNIASIAVGVCGVLILRNNPGWGVHPIVGMALGVVVGGAVQAFCQFPILREKGYRFQKREASDAVWYRDPALRQMLALMVPGLVGLAATQINVLVNTVLATSWGSGAVSWLNYAFRLMQFPIGIFGVSLASATLPLVSKYWVAQDLLALQQTLGSSVRRVFLFNLPASVGLAIMGAPIISLLFEHGAFTRADTVATAQALAAYSVGLCGYSLVKVLVPACYGLQMTRVAVVSSVISVFVTVVLNVAAVRWLGFWGLALGTSLSAWLNAVWLIWAIRSKLRATGGRLPLGSMCREIFWIAVAGAFMGAMCWTYLQWVPAVSTLSVIERMGLVLGGVFLGIFSFALAGAGLGRWLGLSEVFKDLHVVLSKLKRKL